MDERMTDWVIAKLRKMEWSVDLALDQLEDETPDGDSVTLVRAMVLQVREDLTKIFEATFDLEKK